MYNYLHFNFVKFEAICFDGEDNDLDGDADCDDGDCFFVPECSGSYVVGDDNTLSQSINIIAEREITLGFIPVGPKNLIAQILGVPKEEKACDVLSARIIAKLDLGQINGHYFLTQVEAPMDNLTITCNRRYKIKPLGKNNYIRISNLRSFSSNPRDGLLEIIVEPAKKLFKSANNKNSIFTAKTVELDGPSPINVLLEKQGVIKTPVQINLAPKKLRVVVGKDREF